MMKGKLSTVLALLALAATASAQSRRTPEPGTFALTHVTVIDGTGAPARADMTVLVTGGRIAEVGESGKVSVPRGARVVNARGKYLIPGLWDMHVHLAKVGEDALPLFIANGVTSVRDMGGDYAVAPRLKREVAEGRRLGPRIKTAGPILEAARNVERMKSEKTIEFDTFPVERTRIAVGTPEDARRAVALVAKVGGDFVKIRTVESVETYRAIAEAAGRAGLTFVGHVSVPPEEVARAGQRSIEHSFIPPLSNLTAAGREELFEQLAQNGTAVVPTSVTGVKSFPVPYEEAVRIINDSRGRIDARRKYLSGYLLADWKEQAEERRGADLDALIKKLRPGVVRDLKEMRAAGVRVMPGTDAGVLLIFPGFSLHDELQAFVSDLGMTPMEAIVSATRHPAEFFGLQDSLGTVEEGKLADLVLLDADPLRQIGNTQRIAGVVVAGRFISKAELRRMLKRVEAAARRASQKGKSSRT